MVARIVKDADERRVELLDTAVALFAERGYDNTSVQAITDTVGIAKGTFYHYFRSKDDLLAQLAVHVADRMLGEIRRRLDQQGGTAKEKLAFLVGDTAQAKMEMSGVTLPMARFYYRPENQAEMSRYTGQFMDRVRSLFVEVIEQGMAEGSFHVDDPGLTADILLGLLVGLGQRFAPAVTSLEGGTAAVHAFISVMEAFEQAAGRILGVPDGDLVLYDKERLTAAITAAVSKEALE